MARCLTIGNGLAQKSGAETVSPGGPRARRAISAGGAESVDRDIRRLGAVSPPREVVFMARAAIGLGSVFMHLKAEINWYQLFHELIADFDAATLKKRQRKALKQAGVVLPVG